jgi:plastocyanin
MDRRGTQTLAIVAGIVTLACGGFAVAMAVSSDDDGGSGGDAGAPGGTAAEAPAADGIPVAIADFTFVPNPVSVAVGGAVTWTNDDGLAHSVQSDDGVLASDNLNSGESYTATFDAPGEIAYFCGIHPSMTGVVTVTP